MKSVRSFHSLTPFTMLDYPGELACIAWFAGCNLRCAYCHNPKIVLGKGHHTFRDLLDFLRDRHNRLTGVVFSGGEPTLHPELAYYARSIKNLGYKIKLDTNGTRPDVMRSLIADRLVDYIALDYKCLPTSAHLLLKARQYGETIEKALKILVHAHKSGLPCEIRTTWHPDLQGKSEIAAMIRHLDALQYKGTYYLQAIVKSGAGTLGKIKSPEQHINLIPLPEPEHFKLVFRNLFTPSGAGFKEHDGGIRHVPVARGAPNADHTGNPDPSVHHRAH